MSGHDAMSIRALCVQFIREAGDRGITGFELHRKLRALGRDADSIQSYLRSGDMIYEEPYTKKLVRYFWCGEKWRKMV